MQKEYNLVSSVRNKGSKSINLARIAAAFPAVAAACIHKIPETLYNRPVPLSTMRKVCPNYPKILTSTVMISLVPITTDEESRDTLIRAMMLYATLKTIVLSAGERKSFRKAFDVSFPFSKASHTSKLVSEDVRNSIINSDIFGNVFVIKGGNIIDVTESV